ncbi:MAG: PAS domain S-box protein [Deltaproteobacteria bacterium]|nr:PAS domain S-box protein [Deltaproteobacteria bacterium]
MKRSFKLLCGNFEKVFIISSICAAALIIYFLPDNISFLNFFFLPVILAGYYVGIRLSVPGAVFCVCAVVFYTLVSPVELQRPQDTSQVVLFVITWGCFLVLAGALVGNQQEKIQREQLKLVRLNAEVSAAYEKLKNVRVEAVRTRMELEHELRENEKMFRLLFEQDSDAIIVFDTSLRSISDINDAVVRLYGFEREELIGNDLLMLMDEDNRESLCRAFKNSDPGNSFILLRQEHRRKNGTTVPVSCRGRIIEMNGRQHLFCSIWDITIKIHKEEEDALLQAQVLHSEKMASIGVLATGIAHEINNPMAFISSNLLTLEKYLKKIQQYFGFIVQTVEPGMPDELCGVLQEKKQNCKIDFVMQDAVDLVAESTSGAERIKKIVQDLRLFARSDSDEPESFDIHDYIENTINIIWNELKYKAQLQKNYGHVPAMVGFPQKLSQVVMNLLVNAAHAIENQGTITITTLSRDRDVYVSIADTGCGIAEKNLAKIFEPFFTTKEAGKGNGLGLSIASDIVTKKLKGTINVESRVGEGTTFTLRLPIDCSEPA